ncbi:hypothetical protein FQN57_004177 [Myotisia sp. PD_48]|nr:hypothetical protein FQN57_004177 [Myotisia sp. PD_48]
MKTLLLVSLLGAFSNTPSLARVIQPSIIRSAPIVTGTGIPSLGNETPTYPQKLGGTNNDTNPASPCECYVVSGDDAGYFQHYSFYDFRRPPSRSSTVSRKNATHPKRQLRPTSAAHSPLINHDLFAAGPDQAKRYHESLEGTSFVADWDIQAWKRESTPQSPITMLHSWNNVFLVKNSTDEDDETTHLVMRASRLENNTSTAEIQTKLHDILHSSLRVRFRLYAEPEWKDFPKVDAENNSGLFEAPLPPHDPLPAYSSSGEEEEAPGPGVCAGIFTYRSRFQESDIEILTSDPPGRIHYANQPDWDPETDEIIPGASDILDLSVPWTSWATHRLDWFPEISRWYLNDEGQLSKTYGVPTAPSMILLNFWSDGGVWTGNLSVGSSVFMAIEYIEIAYNRSSNRVTPNPSKARRHYDELEHEDGDDEQEGQEYEYDEVENDDDDDDYDDEEREGYEQDGYEFEDDCEDDYEDYTQSDEDHQVHISSHGSRWGDHLETRSDHSLFDGMQQGEDNVSGVALKRKLRNPFRWWREHRNKKKKQKLEDKLREDSGEEPQEEPDNDPSPEPDNDNPEDENEPEPDNDTPEYGNEPEQDNGNPEYGDEPQPDHDNPEYEHEPEPDSGKEHVPDTPKITLPKPPTPPDDTPKCRVICRIDDVQTKGVPEIIWDGRES